MEKDAFIGTAFKTWMLEALSYEIARHFTRISKDTIKSLIQWKSLINPLLEIVLIKEEEKRVRSWFVLARSIIDIIEFEGKYDLSLLLAEIEKIGLEFNISNELLNDTRKLFHTLIVLQFFHSQNIRKARRHLQNEDVFYKDELQVLLHNPESKVPAMLETCELIKNYIPFVEFLLKELGTPFPYKVMNHFKNIEEKAKSKRKFLNEAYKKYLAEKEGDISQQNKKKKVQEVDPDFKVVLNDALWSDKLKSPKTYTKGHINIRADSSILELASDEPGPSRNKYSSPSKNSYSSPSRNKDGSASQNKGSGPSQKKDCSPSRSKESSPSRRTNSSPSRNENSSPARNEDSSPARNTRGKLRAVRNSPSRNKDCSPSLNKDPSPSPNKDCSPAQNKNSSPSRNKASSPARNEDSSLSENEDSRPARNKDSSPPLSEDASPARNKDSSPSRNKGKKNHGKRRRIMNFRQDDSDDSGESVTWSSDEEVAITRSVRTESRKRSSSTSTFRKRTPFTITEEENLRKGIRRYGVGNWSKILKTFDFKSCRTSVSLKDKYRNMVRNGTI